MRQKTHTSTWSCSRRTPIRTLSINTSSFRPQFLHLVVRSQSRHPPRPCQRRILRRRSIRTRSPLQPSPTPTRSPLPLHHSRRIIRLRSHTDRARSRWCRRLAQQPLHVQLRSDVPSTPTCPSFSIPVVIRCAGVAEPAVRGDISGGGLMFTRERILARGGVNGRGRR